MIWNQTDVRSVPNQLENGKYNLISGCFNKISKRFLCVRKLQERSDIGEAWASLVGQLTLVISFLGQEYPYKLSFGGFLGAFFLHRVTSFSRFVEPRENGVWVCLFVYYLICLLWCLIVNQDFFFGKTFMKVLFWGYFQITGEFYLIEFSYYL